MEKKLLLIVNPVSGQKKAVKSLGAILEVFSAAGYLSTVAMTAHSGHATAIAREYAGKYDLVVCAGGDGTLNETISGVLASGAQPSIAYLPCGTTNDLAATLNLSRDLAQAARDAVCGRIRYLDIGSFGERRFVYTASFGAFTKTSYSTPQSMKNALGHLAYVLEGAKEVLNIKSVRAKVKTDAGDFEGDYIFGAVTNTTSLAGILTLDKSTVSLDDGLFELLLVEKPENALETSRLINQILQKRFDDKLKLFKVSCAEIETDEPVDWTLDGEQAQGILRVSIQNHANAVRLIVP